MSDIYFKYYNSVTLALLSPLLQCATGEAEI